ALVAAGDPPPNGLIMRGVQRIERNPRLWGVESGAYSNIKADKAATIKRRIYPLCMGLSNGHGGQQLRKSRGILSVMQISSLGSFPRGRREDIAALRIQTAAKDVNGFGKAIRRQTESRQECETQGDFPTPFSPFGATRADRVFSRRAPRASRRHPSR